ncbi:MAG: LysM peptidoglycan-binding domain-containing protein [Pseudomonadota bacterium]
MKTSAVMLVAAALAGCSAGTPRVKGAPPAPRASAATNEIDVAFDLLMKGDEAGARKRLKAVLKRDPMNANARLLTESIAGDPNELLGPQNYPYAIREGDTVPGLAQRFLGNRLKAYQLLRYNGLKAPTVLTTGQIFKIPGEPPRVEPVRRPDAAPPRPAPQPLAPKPKVAPPKPAAPAAPTANPAAARQLRGAGLAALNQGNVDRAVGLLRRAATLDPGNAVIARDLARAERIAATVKARR